MQHPSFFLRLLIVLPTCAVFSLAPHIVVVGGGWGGMGAAKAACEAGCRVTLLDALPDPTGKTPYLSPTGKPVEAGTRGFWKDYPNIEAMMAELGLREDEVFTPFLNSSFYSPDGLEATAPVFSEGVDLSNFAKSLLPEDLSSLPGPLGALGKTLTSAAEEQLEGFTVPQLPSPLGQVLATFPLFERIPLADRASMAGLLLATLDCLGGDEATKMAYDRTSAHDLFVRFGLSDRLVEDFVKPTLLVGLFKPPEELSALVVMELLYYYALAHQDSFDVRWIRKGTVADSLVAPLADRLLTDAAYDFTVLGGAFVTEVTTTTASTAAPGQIERATKVTYVRSEETSAAGTKERVTRSLDDVDGVVLALGAKGMKAVVGSSPGLAKHAEFSRAASLASIDVISTRLWFDRKVPTRTPANVFSRFPALRGAGGTFFMLDQLQVQNEADERYLWGEAEKNESSGGGGEEEAAAGLAGVTREGAEPSAEAERGSVVSADFYNAGGLLSLPDEDIVRLLTKELLPAAVPAFGDAKVVDSWVGKYPGAVSWFSPGSYAARPPLQGAGSSALPNVKCAGDWVRMGEREHGAKGLCQERAYVSGLEAANALLDDLIADHGDATAGQSGEQEGAAGGGGSAAPGGGVLKFKKHPVLPVRADEPQVEVGYQVSRAVFGSGRNPRRFWVR